jgi:hypothetical protein
MYENKKILENNVPCTLYFVPNQYLLNGSFVNKKIEYACPEQRKGVAAPLNNDYSVRFTLPAECLPAPRRI